MYTFQAAHYSVMPHHQAIQTQHFQQNNVWYTVTTVEIKPLLSYHSSVWAQVSLRPFKVSITAANKFVVLNC